MSHKHLRRRKGRLRDEEMALMQGAVLRIPQFAQSLAHRSLNVPRVVIGDERPEAGFQFRVDISIPLPRRGLLI